MLDIFNEMTPIEKVLSVFQNSIRQKISDLVHKRSGEGRLLSVDDYYPHITIGFTKKDLHANDGIVKDLESCLFATE